MERDDYRPVGCGPDGSGGQRARLNAEPLRVSGTQDPLAA